MERALVAFAEDQQRSIGRDLHDNLGQLITAVLYSSGALNRRLLGSGASLEIVEMAGGIYSNAERAAKSCRDLAHGLIII